VRAGADFPEPSAVSALCSGESGTGSGEAQPPGCRWEAVPAVGAMVAPREVCYFTLTVTLSTSRTSSCRSSSPRKRSFIAVLPYDVMLMLLFVSAVVVP